MSTTELITLKKEINLDVTNVCSLKCPGCARQKDFNGKPISGEELDIKSWEMITDYFDNIIMCGQISDPTFHNNFHTLLEIALRKNVGLRISVAASFRSESWFTKAFLLTKGHDVEWVFSIDGLPSDSHKYRINQDGEKLFKMMKICAGIGNKVTWQYIPFSYNENDIDTCMKMSKDINVTFKKLISSRWRYIEHLRPKDESLSLNRPWQKRK